MSDKDTHIKQAVRILRQVKEIQYYLSSVEADLQDFLGGVGIARKPPAISGMTADGIDIDAIRLKARKQFSKTIKK